MYKERKIHKINQERARKVTRPSFLFDVLHPSINAKVSMVAGEGDGGLKILL